MDAEQGKDLRTGGVPVLNIERIYSTTVPAEELARALADHFRAQEFEAQVFRASGDRTVMQARKESLWRHLLGTAYGIWKENQLDQEVWQVIDERTGVPVAVP